MDVYKLHYYITNGGDGSANLRLSPSAESAEKSDSELDEGWGEPCHGYESIVVDWENRTIAYKDSRFVYDQELSKYVITEEFVPLSKD